MTIYKIKFKRTKDSEWELGIRTESSNQDLIIDKNGLLVEGMIHDFAQICYDFCINLTPILKD